MAGIMHRHLALLAAMARSVNVLVSNNRKIKDWMDDLACRGCET
jgi:hypothetical protein